MRERSRLNSNRKRLVHIAILSLLFIGMGMLLPKTISMVTGAIAYPFHVTNVWLQESSSLIPSFIRDRNSLQSRIEDLENKLIIAERMDLTQQRLIDENNNFRRLLGIDQYDRVVATVIARPDELPYDLLQIDRGSRHGVEIGSPVFIGEDIVIGLVVHVSTNYSFVELITTPGFEATAFVSGPNIVTKMEGFGGGVARVSVPQGIPLASGDLVYLPSVEPGVFGRISFVENRITQPEQYGYVSPDIPISGLHYVSVGKQSQITHSAEEVDEKVLEIMRTELLVEGIVVGGQATTSTSTVPAVEGESVETESGE
ncbi:rod shape-determining protein MreC [Candidatus Kaiserbacteria bacterium]|nr:rod shape-determining protein MreC [Candidatus Kaiserbacteria bacterium]